MKKKNNKKKLPKYALGTRHSLGYQPSLGKSTTSTMTQGENIQPEVNAMRANQFPGAAAKFMGTTLTPLQMLQNTVSIAPGTALTGVNAINKAGGFSNLISKGATPFVSGIDPISGLPTEIGVKTSDKAISTGALNTVGTVLGVAGALKSGIDIGSDIANAGSHRSEGDMLNTRTKTTITGENGNSYDQYSGPNSAAEYAYAKQDRIAKQTGLMADAVGFGASAGGVVGSIIPGVGNLLGMGIGAGLGAVGAGIADLLGFGDTEDDVKWELANATNWTAGQNRQNRSVWQTKEMQANAANGKRPVWTPAGLVGKAATARVSNGEVVGNFEDDIATRIPGQKNNKDTKLAALKDGDFVITNKYGLSDYAAATGDYAGALNLQEMIMGMRNSKGYKNGKLPKCANGMWDSIFSTIPHLVSFAGNMSQYNRAKNADVYAPDVYVDNPEGTKAVNTLAQLRFDADPYYREAQRGLNWANYDVRRNVGLGIGGRAIAQGMNYNNYLRGLADITKMKNEAQNSYIEKYANALANLGATNQGRRMEAAAKRHAWLQQAQGQKESWMAQYRKNIDQNLLNAAADYMRLGQWNASKDIQEKMLGLYERQIANEEYKTRNGMPDVKVQSTTVPTVTTPPQMIARPTDDDIYSKILALAPWKQPQQTKPRSRDPYTNIYNLAPWH